MTFNPDEAPPAWPGPEPENDGDVSGVFIWIMMISLLLAFAAIAAHAVLSGGHPP
jgi:hypothetical protein